MLDRIFQFTGNARLPKNETSLLTAIFVSLSSILASSRSDAETLYTNTFDDADSLTGLSSDGTIAVSGGQFLSEDGEKSYAILDLSTIAGYDTIPQNNRDIVTIGFNVSVDDVAVLNGGFFLDLSATTERAGYVNAFGYSFSGGGMVGDRTVLRYHGEGGSGFLFDLTNGIPDLPKAGTVKIVYNPSNHVWTLHMRIASAYVDPLSLTGFKVGEIVDTSSTGKSLRYLLFGATAAFDDIYFDNISISVGALTNPPDTVSASDQTSQDGISVSWSSVADADSYNLYRAMADDFSQAEFISEANGTMYFDTGVAPGVRYYYWVQTVKDMATTTESLSASGLRGIGSVENLAASTEIYHGRVELTWTEVVGATRYRVYRGESDVFAEAEELGVVTDVSYSDNTAGNGIDYYYRVVAESTDGAVGGEVSTVGSGGGSMPDLSIVHSSGQKLGTGLVNATGIGQSISAVGKRRRPVIRTAWVSSIGTAIDDTVCIRGSRGNRLYRVKYFSGGNIRGLVILGIFKVPTNAEDQAIVIQVKPSRRTYKLRNVKHFDSYLRGTSQKDPSNVDLVRLKVKSLPR